MEDKTCKHSHSYPQAGISISYASSTKIVMKMIKHKPRNEKRKDSIKKILGILYTSMHSKSHRILMKSILKKWKTASRKVSIEKIFKQ